MSDDAGAPPRFRIVLPRDSGLTRPIVAVREDDANYAFAAVLVIAQDIGPKELQNEARELAARYAKREASATRFEQEERCGDYVVFASARLRYEVWKWQSFVELRRVVAPGKGSITKLEGERAKGLSNQLKAKPQPAIVQAMYLGRQVATKQIYWPTLAR